jgi:hypothetical protein
MHRSSLIGPETTFATVATTTWISLAVSAIALVTSLVALYRAYLAPARIRAVVGTMRLRLYEYTDGSDTWHMPVFHVTCSFTNEGARVGVVDGLRLRVHHVEVAPQDNYQTFVPIVVLERSLGLPWDSRESREKWLEESPEWSPATVLPKASVTQHVAFQSDSWDVPVRHNLKADLEIHTDATGDWRPVSSWDIGLTGDSWSWASQGMPIPARPQSHVDSGPRRYPEDLAERLAVHESRHIDTAPGSR